LLALAFFRAEASAEEKEFSVVTLGTGSPLPATDRFGPAVLVTAGDKKLLFDAGRGVTQRLWQLRMPFGSIDAHFLTHLHSDHINGFPDLWLSGWIDSPFGGRTKPLRLFGPLGTKQFAEGLRTAFSWDIEHSGEDQKLDPEGIKIDVKEISEGPIYDEGGVKVSAFLVDHGELLIPSFGYRIDFDRRSVVVSGDTRYSDNLIKHAQGADLLIHAVAAAKDELLNQASFRGIMSHHTPAAEVGMVFAKTQPKLAALIHFVILGDKTTPQPTLQDVENAVRKNYQGPLALTQDLMRFEIGSGTVKVVFSTK
jgi:ribonuclease Z